MAGGRGSKGSLKVSYWLGFYGLIVRSEYWMSVRCYQFRQDVSFFLFPAENYDFPWWNDENAPTVGSMPRTGGSVRFILRARLRPLPRKLPKPLLYNIWNYVGQMGLISPISLCIFIFIESIHSSPNGHRPSSYPCRHRSSSRTSQSSWHSPSLPPRLLVSSPEQCGARGGPWGCRRPGAQQRAGEVLLDDYPEERQVLGIWRHGVGWDYPPETPQHVQLLVLIVAAVVPEGEGDQLDPIVPGYHMSNWPEFSSPSFSAIAFSLRFSIKIL